MAEKHTKSKKNKSKRQVDAHFETLDNDMVC